MRRLQNQHCLAANKTRKLITRPRLAQPRKFDESSSGSDSDSDGGPEGQGGGSSSGGQRGRNRWGCRTPLPPTCAFFSSNIPMIREGTTMHLEQRGDNYSPCFRRDCSCFCCRLFFACSHRPRGDEPGMRMPDVADVMKTTARRVRRGYRQRAQR